MSLINRRDFFGLASAAASVPMFAKPLGIPIGIQPYTVRNEMEKDFEGTVRQLAQMGYEAIEAGEPFYNQTPEAAQRLFKSCGLVSYCGFYPYSDDDAEWTKTMDRAAAAGKQYAVTYPPRAWANSLDGWKRTAERFNKIGAISRKAGVTVAYHNHNFEFREFEGKVALDEFLRLTDPKLVAMEMDCFWTSYAGKDPVDYFRRFPGRFPLLHIKDLKAGQGIGLESPKGNPFAEVGSGIIDYKRIFEAARGGGLKHYYVEQDRWDRSPIESARLSCEYLKKLTV